MLQNNTPHVRLKGVTARITKCLAAVHTLTAGKGPTLLRDKPTCEFLPYPPQAVKTVTPKARTVTQKAEKETTDPSPAQ